MKILSTEEARYCQNYSLQRGHVVFTSFISYNGKIVFLDSHLLRLVKGADFLFPDKSWSSNLDKIKEYVETEFFLLKDRVINNYYFRLTIFDDFLFLQSRVHEVFSDALKLMSALKIKTPGILPSYLKLSNYVESDFELKRSQLMGFDDVVYFDTDQNMTEATSSNLLVVNAQGVIISPPPSSLILEGVMRQNFLKKLNNLGFKVEEKMVAKKDLYNAKEIWLTNSVKGLRFVSQFEEVLFDKMNSTYLKMVAIFGRYGEKYE